MGVGEELGVVSLGALDGAGRVSDSRRTNRYTKPFYLEPCQGSRRETGFSLFICKRGMYPKRNINLAIKVNFPLRVQA